MDVADNLVVFTSSPVRLHGLIDHATAFLRELPPTIHHPAETLFLTTHRGTTQATTTALHSGDHTALSKLYYHMALRGTTASELIRVG